jgi:hypothetical protein
VYLYCDTAKRQARVDELLTTEDGKVISTIYAEDRPIPYAMWRRGYNVFAVYCCVNVNYNREQDVYIPGEYKEHVEYLDDKKKPLSKNIIIWMSQ